MLGPEEDEDFTSEYARFAKNARGIPDDFDSWVSDLGGRASREANRNRKKKRQSRRKPLEYGDD